MESKINLSTIKPKKLKLSEFELGQTLGTGSFGRVKISKQKSTGKYFAIKVLKKAEIIKLKQVDHIMNEVKILSAIDHPFLINTGGFTQDDRYIYLVLELINGGELFTYLRSVGKFSCDHATFYAAQVCLMFEYLHSKDIIYRDLKPENMLLDSQGHLKMTDFGLSKNNFGVSNNLTFSVVGTPEYISPEILNRTGHTQAVDWWSLGILLYEMYHG